MEAHKLAKELAACLYYEASGTDKPFEKLPVEEVGLWLKRGVAIVQHIEKINLEVVPMGSKQQVKEDDIKYLERLTLIIDKFVKGLNTTKPGLFPSAELAHKILRGG